ncbi:MAG: DUF4912 domain-containing protein [Lyngbya sp. HA4199-MV5]|jgi:phosphate transport system substrate-binding protein|nr:DUF4912 domain-containing protein [Lyngbya sp. HA4199-MV5]
MTRLRNQLSKQKTAIVSFSVLLATTIGGITAKPLVAAWIVNPVLTQVLGASAFPLPTSVPAGTVIRIGGSSGMETINQVLKRRFEQQFVGTDVVLNTQGTGPAIKDVLDGNADLAAIGRSLTEQEKAQGLVPVPVSRHKIAIIVGTQNSFKGDLTFEQFAKIFRGEIKDWSQLGGARGAIRFIDRPTSSDTRQAFRNYPVFKKAPFVTGKTARQVADSTSQVVQALGEDGIGYAIADQLEGRGDVRVLTMHKTLPSNPKYPFSRPLIYVYKGPQPNPSAQAFLGFASAPASRKTIETARKEATTLLTANPDVASPSPKVSVPSSPAAKPSVTAAPQTASPTPSKATESAPASVIPWWLWLLALPLLGGLFWWLLKDREGQPEPEETLSEPMEPDVLLEEAIVPVPEIAPPLLETAHSTGRSRITLEPCNCTDAYASWEIPAEAKETFQQQGARKLVLRLYDVTGVDLQQQPPISLQEFDCDVGAHDRHLPIRTDDRDYLAELGYIAEDGRWLQVARSESVHVPPCPLGQPPITTDEATPVSDLPPPQGDDAVKSGGVPLVDRGVAEDPLPEDDTGTRTMLAGDRTHFPLSPEATPVSWVPSNPKAAYAYLDGTAGATTVEATSLSFAHKTAKEDNHDRSSAASEPSSQGEIVLVPRDRQSAYIHWTVSQADKDALKHQGGQQLVLRVYDVMGTETTTGYSRQEFLCNEWEHDQQVPIPVSNVDYVAELGYTTFDGRFLTLARSPATRVPGA